jgi:hypothetical protein
MLGDVPFMLARSSRSNSNDQISSHIYYQDGNGGLMAQYNILGVNK